MDHKDRDRTNLGSNPTNRHRHKCPISDHLRETVAGQFKRSIISSAPMPEFPHNGKIIKIAGDIPGKEAEANVIYLPH